MMTTDNGWHAAGPGDAAIRFVIRLCLVATVLMAQSKSVGATPPSPLIDYAIESTNGKYVLVLLIPDGLTPDSVPRPELRQNYPHSGLYTQTGSLVWKIDWYLPPGRGPTGEWITLLDDGEHLIVWAQPLPNNKSIGTTACDDIVLGFYEQGEEVKSYRVSELVTCPGHMLQAGGYLWKSSFAVYPETQTLRIITTNDQIIDFDIKTGNIANPDAGNNTNTNATQWGWQLYFLAGAGIVTIIVIAFMGRRLRLGRTKKS